MLVGYGRLDPRILRAAVRETSLFFQEADLPVNGRKVEPFDGPESSIEKALPAGDAYTVGFLGITFGDFPLYMQASARFAEGMGGIDG